MIFLINWDISIKSISHASFSLFSFKKNQTEKFVISLLFFSIHISWVLNSSFKEGEKRIKVKTVYFLTHVYTPSPRDFLQFQSLWKAPSFPINMCLSSKKFTKAFLPWIYLAVYLIILSPSKQTSQCQSLGHPVTNCYWYIDCLIINTWGKWIA